ncbi:MAG: hypothetical protein AB7W59_00015 [Acidimicrobiia bacterium]
MGFKTVQSAALDTVDSNTATIPEAYEELSQEALALWLRLHHCSDEQLSAGRASLARTVFKISETRANVLLRELRLKGYIAIHGSGPPNPSRVELLKRCKIVGRTRFITLSRMAAPTRQPMGSDSEGSCMLPNARAGTDSNEAPTHPSNGGNGIPRVTYEDDHWLLPVWNDSVPRQRENEEPTHIRSIKRSMASGPGMGSKTKHGRQSDDTSSATEDSARVWEKLAPTLVEVMDLLSVHGPKSNAKSSSRSRSGIDLSRMKKSKERVRAERGLPRPKHPAAGQPIDWSKLDKTGAPAISFSPTDARREGMIHLLTSEYRRLRPRERELRTALMSKLRTEFIRIYTRYRRAALLEMNANSTYYEVHASEYKFAEKVAVSCILKGVTPIQVLRYWHKNIRKFANAKMVVPPLTFLSQASFIDEVAIAVLAGSADVAGGGASPDAGKGWKPPKRKTMWLGDTSTLHPRLRRDLMKAGFDISKYNDSDLACIQDYAMDVKAGKDFKLYPEVLRPMIKWALKHTLKDINPKDTLWTGA